MKYIIFECSPPEAEFIIVVPIVFPNLLCHADVAEALKPLFLKHMWSAAPVSAGSVNVVLRSDACSGKSETLGLSSGPDDAMRITFNDYHCIEDKESTHDT